MNWLSKWRGRAQHPHAGVEYWPIGVVRCPIREPLRPEEMRGIEAVLVLEERLAPAVAALQRGDHLWVISHLHRVEPWSDRQMAALFRRRTASRPNPIGVTLVRVVSVRDSTVTVVGLDAIDGTPILDMKPYKPVYDTLPVHPAERDAEAAERDQPWIPAAITNRPVVALTGGPGGGKSSLIEDLAADPAWSGRFVALPEAVQYARFVQIRPQEKLFQRAIVHLQLGLEEAIDRVLGPGDRRPVICHRGTLDPLAFWIQRGWPREEFFAFTGLPLEGHYARYAAVLHLVTAADGVPWEYTRWPHAHRPEDAEEAMRLDHWLEEAWSGHPCYHRLDNDGRDWVAKSEEARQILSQYLADWIQ
jgi:tRNA (Thr-GGU) A37 N-methylase